MSTYAFTISDHLCGRLTTGRCSPGLLKELEQLLVNRITNIFMITDEIAALEGSPLARRPTRTKPSTQFRGKWLKGLWHKHHLHSSIASMARNIANQWSNKREVFAVADGLGKDELWKVAGQISHRIVCDGYKERGDAGEMTGEWLVYANQNGVNYYLTLASHTESDETVWHRCKVCSKDFPDLLILQEDRC